MIRAHKCIALFTLLIVILVPVLSFSSCDKEIPDREYSEAEVLSAASSLLEKTEMLNVVIYGKGIGTNGSTNNQVGAYAEADFLHLQTLGFSTISELEAKIRETYTASHADYIISTVLSPIMIDGVMVSNTRYYQKYEDEVNKTNPICIMVHREYEYVFTDSIVYDYSTLKVKDVEGNTLMISVMATVTDGDGNSQTTELVFELIEEANGWRINTNTFRNYNAYLDEYENLKDKPIK